MLYFRCDELTAIDSWCPQFKIEYLVELLNSSAPLFLCVSDLNFYLTREAAISIARRVYTVASCLRYSAEA